ncbi:hypothetical protein C8J56DRAFT_925097 [Mycena floridula]|nr:hypothetical protein C8J56DRAFT_925097 [Mycena floridula]
MKNIVHSVLLLLILDQPETSLSTSQLAAHDMGFYGKVDTWSKWEGPLDKRDRLITHPWFPERVLWARTRMAQPAIFGWLERQCVFSDSTAQSASFVMKEVLLHLANGSHRQVESAIDYDAMQQYLLAQPDLTTILANVGANIITVPEALDHIAAICPNSPDMLHHAIIYFRLVEKSINEARVGIQPVEAAALISNVPSIATPITPVVFSPKTRHGIEYLQSLTAYFAKRPGYAVFCENIQAFQQNRVSPQEVCDQAIELLQDEKLQEGFSRFIEDLFPDRKIPSRPSSLEHPDRPAISSDIVDASVQSHTNRQASGVSAASVSPSQPGLPIPRPALPIPRPLPASSSQPNIGANAVQQSIPDRTIIDLPGSDKPALNWQQNLIPIDPARAPSPDPLTTIISANDGQTETPETERTQLQPAKTAPESLAQGQSRQISRMREQIQALRTQNTSLSAENKRYRDELAEREPLIRIKELEIENRRLSGENSEFRELLLSWKSFGVEDSRLTLFQDIFDAFKVPQRKKIVWEDDAANEGDGSADFPMFDDNGKALMDRLSTFLASRSRPS